MERAAHPPMFGASDLPTLRLAARYLLTAPAVEGAFVTAARLCDHDAISMPSERSAIVRGGHDGNRARPMTAVFFGMAICAGVFMVVQASINGQVRIRLDNPWQAALVST